MPLDEHDTANTERAAVRHQDDEGESGLLSQPNSAPARDMEGSLSNEIFAAIAEIHRRELRAIARARFAQSELEEARRGNRYQIGRAFLKSARALLAWFTRTSARRRNNDACSDVGAVTTLDAENITVGFGSKTVIYIPLTLKGQRVRLPAQPDGVSVWITLLCEHPETTVTVDIASHESRQPSRPTRWKLLPGRSCRCYEMQYVQRAFDLHLQRVRGEFCVARIERRDFGYLASERHPEASCPVAPRKITGGFPRIDRHQHQFGATALDRKLWGGFARYAIPELERIRNDSRQSNQQRDAAAWYLTRWFFAERNYLRALENVEFCKQLRKPTRQRTALAEIQCLVKLGRYAQAYSALDRRETAENIEFQLIKSTVLRQLPQGGEEAQLEAINAVLVANGLAALEKKNANLPLGITNIKCNAQSRLSSHTKRVSVIVPAFNCASTISWSLESVLNQTWRNLEVIVVDDLSTDNTCEIVSEISKLDDRVRLIRRTANGGAYAARNVGASAATGDLVMIHDTDDWSHPQRIELQIEELIRNPAAVGTKSYWARVSADLRLQGTWTVSGSLFELNFSSLLIAREVLRAIGPWDEVPISGDAEFYSRIRALYGDDSVVRLPKQLLLALALTREDSLTRAEATHLRSTLYGLRWNYRDAFVFWHDKLPGGGQREHLPFEPLGPTRPFPLPLGMKRGNRGGPNFDVVVMADFSLSAERLDGTLNGLVALAKVGQKVAVFHWPLYELASRSPLIGRLYEVCLSFNIDILSPGDVVDCEVLLFPEPAILQHRIEPLPQVVPRRVIVEHSRPGAESSEEPSFDYDSVAVRSHLQLLFGTESVWVAAGEGVRQAVDRRSR